MIFKANREQVGLLYKGPSVDFVLDIAEYMNKNRWHSDYVYMHVSVFWLHVQTCFLYLNQNSYQALQLMVLGSKGDDFRRALHVILIVQF